MDGGLLTTGMLLLPVGVGALCLFIRPPHRVLWIAAIGVIAHTLLSALVAVRVFTTGPLVAASNWLRVDALSAYHLLVMGAVFSLSAVYACGYFGVELREGTLTGAQARRFAGLFCLSLASMTLVLISNNLGLMWIGIETTTLLTAFLICVHVNRTSLEAMWKYLLVCSVGVAFAFMGTLLAGASAARLHLRTEAGLLWTELWANAAALDPFTMKAAFLFLLVGYGTKTGLAPMHSWLPDAHSQAPTPVSAIFSGFMLNASLYCVMRYVPLVEGAIGHSGWSLRILTVFGLVSIVVAAAFIVFQRDVKRLLAYHSVEHLGIITLGLGLGGLGNFAALFHTLNHSLSKSLSFFAAGRLGQMHGSHDIEAIGGSLRHAPLWGMGLFASILALIGMAPFALFMSEFQIMRAAAEGEHYLPLAVFLLGAAVVFVGASRHAIAIAWGDAHGQAKPARAARADPVLVFAPLAVLLLLGLAMPDPLRHALEQAAAIVGGQP